MGSLFCCSGEKAKSWKLSKEMFQNQVMIMHQITKVSFWNGKHFACYQAFIKSRSCMIFHPLLKSIGGIWMVDILLCVCHESIVFLCLQKLLHFILIFKRIVLPSSPSIKVIFSGFCECITLIRRGLPSVSVLH